MKTDSIEHFRRQPTPSNTVDCGQGHADNPCNHLATIGTISLGRTVCKE